MGGRTSAFGNLWGLPQQTSLKTFSAQLTTRPHKFICPSWPVRKMHYTKDSEMLSSEEGIRGRQGYPWFASHPRHLGRWIHLQTASVFLILLDSLRKLNILLVASGTIWRRCCATLEALIFGPSIAADEHWRLRGLWYGPLWVRT